MHSIRSTQGQAAVELVAVLPLVAAVCAMAWQLVLAGQAVWAVGSAARAAARAQAVGHDPERAARDTLARRLERGLRVRVTDGSSGEVRVSVAIPSVLKALPLGSASATARFAPQGVEAG